MGDRRLRWTIMAEIFGAILVGMVMLIDIFEQPTSRINVPVGAAILILILVAMIVVGVIGLVRSRKS